MGVSITVEWPGSSEDQQGDHPGFQNDDHMWANWMVNVIEKPNLAGLLEKLGGEVLLYHNTSNLPVNQIGWAKPEEFEKAAITIRDLVAAKDARVTPLIDVYRVEWNRLIGDGEGESTEEWFIRDLEDVVGIARYAQAQGARKMTLGYYW